MKVLTHSLLIALAFLTATAQENPSGQTPTPNKLTAEAPKSITGHFERAVFYDQKNDFATANSHFAKVVQLYHDKPKPEHLEVFAQACYYLADDYFYRKADAGNAMKYAKEGLGAEPQHKKLRIIEAVILGSNSSSRDEAAARFDALAQQYPDDAEVHLPYARFLKGFNPMGAVPHYEIGLKHDQNNLALLVTVGTIYNNEASRLSAAGSADSEQIFMLAKKALHYFNRAFQLNPTDWETANIVSQIEREIRLPADAAPGNQPY